MIHDLLCFKIKFVQVDVRLALSLFQQTGAHTYTHTHTHKHTHTHTHTHFAPKVMPPVYFHGNYKSYKEHKNTI